MKLYAVHTEDGIRTAAACEDGYNAPSTTHLPAVFASPLADDVRVEADASIVLPFRPGKIIAIGLNYRDHAAEAKLELPSAPLIMSKLTSSLIGPGANIEFDPHMVARVDWEVELGFIVGRVARRVREAHALDYVLGYTVTNDITARDVQWSESQWVHAKSLDTFCPVGPCVVTADEIPDPQALPLSCRVNGEEVQRSSTDQMIFGVAELLAYLSQRFTLEPGDLIMTGTPWGVGEFSKPQRSLHHGDLLESEVAHVGVLRNQVVEVTQGRAESAPEPHAA